MTARIVANAERVVVHSAPEHVSNTVVLEIVANQITLVVGFDQDLARSTAHALLAALRQINQGVPR